MSDHNKTIHIWVISRKYPPNFSGSAIQANQILRKLIHLGFSVTVLTAGDLAASHLRRQKIRRNGINIRYLPTIRFKEWITVAEARKIDKIIPYFRMLLGAFSLSILAAWTLWQEGKRNDIVRIYAPNAFSFLPIWVARARGMHSILHMTLLNSDDPDGIYKNSNKFEAILTLKSFFIANSITGYSSAQIKSCLSVGLDPQKILRVPGGVDLNKFKPVSVEERIAIRQKLGLNPDSLYIIFAGAAIARKGIDVLVDAFLRVHSQVGNVELLIVGPCDFSDPRHKLACALRDELDATDQVSLVHWIGQVDNVRDYMRASDIFCFPSRREGFGLVIIEAMASGLPVVVSQIEGITTDIIQSDREGICIPSFNPDDYAAALLRLIKNPTMAKEMGEAARLRTVTKFNLEHVAQQYAQLYRSLIDV